MAVTSYELAQIATLAADDKKASDIVALDLSQISDVCDYFVVCTVMSAPQMDAVVEEVQDKVRINAGLKPLSVEGRAGARWTLVDFGSVVVHVFMPEARDYYRLENLWGEASHVDFGQGAHTQDDAQGATTE